MMFIPWFSVPNAVDGGETYVAALAVTGVHDDTGPRGLRELVVPGFNKTIKTSLSVDEVFQRMGEAIEGARNAEIEALAPPSLDSMGSWDAVPQRNTSDDQPAEPLPGWAEGWLPNR